MDPIYRNPSFSMDREVSRSVENKNARNSYRATIEDLSRGVQSKKVSMDREAIKHPKSSSMDRVAIKNVIKRRQKGSMDSLAVKRY